MVKCVPLALTPFLMAAALRPSSAYECDFTIDCNVAGLAGLIAEAAPRKGRTVKYTTPVRDLGSTMINQNYTSYYIDVFLGDRKYTLNYSDLGNNGPDANDKLRVEELFRNRTRKVWNDDGLNGFSSLDKRYGRTRGQDLIRPPPVQIAYKDTLEEADQEYREVVVHLARELLKSK